MNIKISKIVAQLEIGLLGFENETITGENEMQITDASKVYQNFQEQLIRDFDT